MSDQTQQNFAPQPKKTTFRKKWLLVATVVVVLIGMGLGASYWFLWREAKQEVSLLPEAPSAQDKELVENQVEKINDVSVDSLSESEAYYHHLTLASQLNALGRFADSAAEIEKAKNTGVELDGHFYMVRAEWNVLQNENQAAKDDYRAAKREMPNTPEDYRIDEQTIDLMIAGL